MGRADLRSPGCALGRVTKHRRSARVYGRPTPDRLRVWAPRWHQLWIVHLKLGVPGCFVRPARGVRGGPLSLRVVRVSKLCDERRATSDERRATSDERRASRISSICIVLFTGRLNGEKHDNDKFAEVTIEDGKKRNDRIRGGSLPPQKPVLRREYLQIVDARVGSCLSPIVLPNFLRAARGSQSRNEG
ncbi:hypothetical protein GY45DRAFT_170066 [Cubamyces sp. BRFM 1775]|nr:hypothetical protein GY45DRAFT_170066 [Cubamyces sp. BRFM 1775]